MTLKAVGPAGAGAAEGSSSPHAPSAITNEETRTTPSRRMRSPKAGARVRATLDLLTPSAQLHLEPEPPRRVDELVRGLDLERDGDGRLGLLGDHRPHRDGAGPGV